MRVRLLVACSLALAVAGCLEGPASVGYTLEEWTPDPCDPGQVDEVAVAQWIPGFYNDAWGVAQMIADAVGDPIRDPTPVADNETAIIWETGSGFVGREREYRRQYFYSSPDAPFGNRTQDLLAVVGAILDDMPLPDGYEYSLNPPQEVAEQMDEMGVPFHSAGVDQSFQGVRVVSSKLSVRSHDSSAVRIELWPPVDTSLADGSLTPLDARQIAEDFVLCAVTGSTIQDRGASSGPTYSSTEGDSVYDWASLLVMNDKWFAYSIQVRYSTPDCPYLNNMVQLDAVTGAILYFLPWDC